MYTLGVTIFLVLTAVLLTLAAGVVTMSVGGRYNIKRSHQFMYLRISLQLLAFLLLLLAVYLGTLING